jgi:uncharacterized YccA/Bax inhibitor family protein
MALFKSGNPILREKTFSDIKETAGTGDAMTLQGTVNKTGFLLFTLIIPAMFVWGQFSETRDYSSIAPYLWVGIGGGFVTAIILVFRKNLAPYLSVLYALFEGLALGGLSAMMEFQYPGIVIDALLLTFGILISLLIVYKMGIIKATENFKLIVFSATAGIGVYYLIYFVLSFFNITVPLVNDNSFGGILFSVFVVIIAAMNLVVDFDFIEQGVAHKVPKYMEWYGAFGIMVTLVWLYIEILRLLAKSRR